MQVVVLNGTLTEAEQDSYVRQVTAVYPMSIIEKLFLDVQGEGVVKIPYIQFTDDQKRRASEVDLEQFLLRQGEKLLTSGFEKYPTHIPAGRRQGKVFLLLLFLLSSGSIDRSLRGSDPRCSFHHTGSSDRLYVFEAPIDLLLSSGSIDRSLLPVQQTGDGFRIGQIVELLDEGDRPAARFHGVIVPFIPANGDAVVAGKTLFKNSYLHYQSIGFGTVSRNSACLAAFQPDGSSVNWMYGIFTTPSLIFLLASAILVLRRGCRCKWLF